MTHRYWHPVVTLAFLSLASKPSAAQQTAKPLPDLAATNCEFLPPSAQKGNTNIRLVFRFKNVGVSDAVLRQGATIWSLSGPPAGSGSQVNTEPNYTIRPGQEVESANTMPDLGSLPEGWHTFVATVDPKNEVVDSNRSNNRTKCVLTIVR